ncbi:MAG: 1-acyl-sn-glycerol-3-phosphate acyltransferase [Deltaproteobacteria bacterium]|nr:1-acyl-sn-glycerol-3-phosphate acyltransferase [Deltaproteobacteria bacterium]
MRTLRRLIYTLVVVVWVILVTIVMGLLAITTAFFSRKGNGPHLVARTWAKSILWVSRVKVNLKGLDNLPGDTPCILMPNHQSNFDIPVLLGRLPIQFRWLAKAELFKIPIFGRGMRGCGYISIDRTNRKSAFKSLAEAARKIRDGASVLIFPEGTRSRDGDIGPFKKGGFVLTVDAGVPIVPIIIYGTRTIMPKGRLIMQRAEAYMEILPPVETSGYTRKTKDLLIEEVRSIICTAFDRVRESSP